MTNKFLGFSLRAKIFRLDAVNANPINPRWRWHRSSENQPMLHRFILWHIGVKLMASDNLEFRFYFHAENLRLRDKKETPPNVDDSKQFSRPSARDGNGLFLLADEKMMKNIFTLYDGRYVRWHLMKKSDFPFFPRWSVERRWRFMRRLCSAACWGGVRFMHWPRPCADFPERTRNVAKQQHKSFVLRYFYIINVADHKQFSTRHR